MTKWFHFDDGSNPYGVWDRRPDEFFRMIVAWQPTIVNSTSFQCHTPTEAYYHSVSYAFKKNALLAFAKEYQRYIVDTSAEDKSWYEKFFRTYGKRYGILKELYKIGILPKE